MPKSVLENLQEAGRLDLMDFMTFEVAPDAEHPQMQNEGMRYEGLRFRTECRLAGELLGTMRPLDAERLRLALAQTFEFRGTHAVPSSVPDPPEGQRARLDDT